MPSENRSLHRKLAQIMYEAERIPKRGKAPAAMGGFPFVQVGDAADYIRKALGSALVTMLPTKVTVVGQVDRPTKSGGSMTTVDLVTEWTLTDGESGESITIESYGAGADGGDKYSGKASTSTLKYALLTAFLLSTGEDSELGTTEAGTARREKPAERITNGDGGLIGVAEVGKSAQSDFELRQTPDGMALGFRLKGDKGGIKVVAHDPLATLLFNLKDEVVGQRVTCWGAVKDETFTVNKGKPNAKDITYPVLTLAKIKTASFVLPAEPGDVPAEPIEAASVPLFDEDEQSAIDKALATV